MSGWATRKTAEDIRQMVSHGKVREGGQLPSERDLAHALQVSRATVRSALQILREDGEVETRQGAGGGTFVSKSSKYWFLYSKADESPHNRVSHPTGIPQGVPESIKNEGYKSESIVLETTQLKANAYVAKQLKIPKNSDIFRLRRLRKSDEESVAVECAYLPCSLFPKIEEKNLKQSLYMLIQDDYKMTITRITESFEVIPSSEANAEILGIAVGAPLMKSLSIAYGKEGTPLEYSCDLYRADRVKFVVENDFI